MGGRASPIRLSVAANAGGSLSPRHRGDGTPTATRRIGKTFDQLSAAHQDDVLTGLDGAKLTFDVVPAKAFFEMLLQNTVEGFFADPLYGGNRDKVGWKLVGFPGVAAYYADKITD